MKAMVLCAGYGTRLGALTRDVPKPMLPVAGYPLLAYVLSNLQRHGFDQVAINLHFRPEVIRDYFGQGADWQTSITYSEESRLLGTAGGLKSMAHFFQEEEAFLVHYGDILTDQNFIPMLEFHRQRRALATLLVHQRVRSNSVLTLDKLGRITEFQERPDESHRQPQESPWVNSGICIGSPELLEAIPEDQACDLARDIFPKLVSSERLYGFALSGYRCAIDSEERLAQAAQAVESAACTIRLAKRGPVKATG